MANSVKQSHIRNFSIIAHIDHGKSTLADRLLEATKTVASREMEEQLLDSMDLERERGITIKARAVRLSYTAKNGETYDLNLIDTPGHVDFNYEVSRSLNACEGAILVVDATQGIEAQTLANAYLAVDANLEILPVVNKIDLPSADIDGARREIEDVIGIPAMDCPAVSAKMGINIGDVLEHIVTDIPAPSGDENAPLKALIFDSYYDSYLGVVVYIRVVDGKLKSGDTIRMMSTGQTFGVVDVGVMDAFGLSKREELSAGEVGYLTASIKSVGDTRVGDTVTLAECPAAEALPGFKAVQPMVYAGIYPADGSRYGDLRDALEKLRLNDAALSFEPETSVALGFGYRCGFLGLLHMEIIEERLEREFNLDLITTAPSVIYEITKRDGERLRIDNPTNFPDPAEIEKAFEPIVKASIITPTDYVGGLMDLCQDRRGEFVDMKYLDSARVELHYRLPLNEIIYDFFDALKSRSRGYASLDYELEGYVESKLVKLDFLLNGEQVDALSFIVHEEKAYARARRIAEKLKDNIPRQLFEVPIQAAIGSKIIARETVKAMRKDVLAKCYGGDITRKKKLLEKQKEGKKKMRQLGSVQISPEAFMAVLKLDDND
ncbi:MAG: translation elongation factor 4 [Clostridia bacterium]|nr:translation elongation factor 4 [Clostridia bacterium]